jgi:dienelactone hydrolase
MPFRVEGVLAVPEGPGPFPIIIVLHNAHGGCPLNRSQQDIVTEQWPCRPAEERRADIGLSYLVSRLAARGFVVVAPNLNAVYVSAFGAVAPDPRRYPEVLDAHLQALVAASKRDNSAFGQSLVGKLDLRRIGMIGHGHGGQLAMQSARARAELNPRRAPEGSQPLMGVLLVAPVYTNVGDVNVPLGVLLPACDGLLPDLSGQMYYEDARLNRKRATLAASVYIPNANSNFFNAAVGEDDAVRVVSVPGCDKPRALLSRTAHHRILTRFAADFFDVALNRSAPIAGLDPHGHIPSRLYDLPVQVALTAPGALRSVIVQPSSKEEVSNNNLGGFSAADGATRADYCAPRASCGRWSIVPGNPAMVRFSWNAPLRAAWDIGLGDGPIDLTQYALLHLRVVPDPSDALNDLRKPHTLRLILMDDQGKTAAVRLETKDTPALAYPPGAPDARTFAWLGHAFLGSVHVPLAQFSEVDLTRISTMRIEPASDASGSLFFADLEFIRQDVVGAAAQ